MKKMTRILSLLLCLTVALSMSFAFPQKASAVSTATVKSGSTLKAVEYNSSGIGTCYLTPASQATKLYNDFNYNVTVPEKGTLVIQYYANSGSPFVSVSGLGASFPTNDTAGTDKVKAYTVTSGGTAKLSISSVDKGATVGFFVYYFPASRTISANTSNYVLGKVGNSAVSTFNVATPSKGWLEVTVIDAFSSNYSTYVMTAGFNGWEYMSSSRNYSTGIGFKAGTHTIQVKGIASAYRIKTVFHPVKETSNKTSKKKAAKIKKKKSNKAIIPAGSSKAHWYKIKQPSNKKMTLVVNAGYLSNGGPSTGKLKVTMYYPNGKHESRTLYPGYKGTYKVYYGRGFTKKAARGTYYVKVKPSGGANGYFTLKWK